MEDMYEIIRRNMNTNWPIKLPKHKKIIELFKIIWPTEEEVRIIASFREPLMDLKSPKKISKLTGIPLERVMAACEAMVKRGVIAKSGKDYAMFPPAPGIMDYYFIASSDSKENLEKVAKLWLEIENSGLANEIGNSDYPFFRTMPASSLPQRVAKEIDINEEMLIQHDILLFEDVARYIKQAKSISVVNCVCRTYNALGGASRCEKPWNICIYLNMSSDIARAMNLGREITTEEAFELLKKAEDHGLVHTIINGSSPETATVICNCCACHCSILGALLKHENPRAFARSNFRPEITTALCEKCETCVRICPMTAIWHHYPHTEDLSDDYITFKEHRCIGCGLCAHHCPNSAISMRKIYSDLPADTLAGILHEINARKRH